MGSKCIQDGINKKRTKNFRGKIRGTFPTDRILYEHYAAKYESESFCV